MMRPKPSQLEGATRDLGPCAPWLRGKLASDDCEKLISDTIPLGRSPHLFSRSETWPRAAVLEGGKGSWSQPLRGSCMVGTGVEVRRPHFPAKPPVIAASHETLKCLDMTNLYSRPSEDQGHSYSSRCPVSRIYLG
jgi:hypothetical protein